MDIGRLIRTAREDSSFSLRALAHLAGTSHSALAAYESNRKVPRADTLIRVLGATGRRVSVTRDPESVLESRRVRGEELEEVLRLAGHFPARHDATLRYPRFGDG